MNENTRSKLPMIHSHRLRLQVPRCRTARTVRGDTTGDWLQSNAFKRTIHVIISTADSYSVFVKIPFSFFKCSMYTTMARIEKLKKGAKGWMTRKGVDWGSAIQSSWKNESLVFIIDWLAKRPSDSLTYWRCLVPRLHHCARSMCFGSRGLSEAFRLPSQIRHRNALTGKAWEDAVQGLGNYWFSKSVTDWLTE